MDMSQLAKVEYAPQNPVRSPSCKAALFCTHIQEAGSTAMATFPRPMAAALVNMPVPNKYFMRPERERKRENEREREREREKERKMRPMIKQAIMLPKHGCDVMIKAVGTIMIIRVRINIQGFAQYQAGQWRSPCG